MADALEIDTITVKSKRIVCDVVVTQKRFHYATPELMGKLLKEFPHLPTHTCKNAVGSTFAAVMDHTSLPHVLEHLVIDLQVQACSDVDRTFVGTTEWLDESMGKARIEVSFTDDLNALRAFRDATRILNNAMI